MRSPACQPHLRAAAAIATAALVVIGCSSDDSPESSSSSTVESSGDQDGDVFVDGASSTVPAAVVSCGATSGDVPDDWPFAVAEDIDVAQTLRFGDRYVLVGATRDSEQVLIDTLDMSFPGFDIGEPTGGVSDINVRVGAPDGDGILQMTDRNEDGCWTVRIVAKYGDDADLSDEEIAEPAIVGEERGDDGDAGSTDDSIETGDAASDDTVPPEPEPADTVPEVTIDPFDEVTAVGRGEVLSARGTFQVALSACSTLPLAVDGVASIADLRIVGGSDEVEVEWTYDDGVVITDDDATVLNLDTGGGTIVADGENQDGPETLFITFQCDDE